MRIFVTGASGWIGSAVVPELIGTGHQVVALARSDASAAALASAGAEVERGTLDDLDTLGRAAAAADGVLHLAFKHDLAFSGDFQGAADADRRAVEIFGETLEGTDRPFVLASGLLGIAPGRVATERDMPAGHPNAGMRTRMETAALAIGFASHGVRSSIVRLSPTVHGRGDHGFLAALIGIAREKRTSGYVADGANRWPAVHVLDAARLFRLALESATPGSILHAAAEEGVPVHAIAEVIGRHLDVPVATVASADAVEHFGWLAGFIGMNGPASSTLTRDQLGWQITQPGLIDDLDAGHYFLEAARTM